MDFFMRINWLRGQYVSAILLILAVALAGVLRVQKLGNSLGHDEAYTLEAFASQPYQRIVTSYAAPNNHILHTLLVRFAVRMLGKENWTARLPAFFAGVLSVPIMFLLGRHLFACSSAGLIAAWLLALSPVHISYSQVARGYSLLLLMAILSLYFLCRALANGKISEWGGFSCCSFLAAWTVPSGVFHLLGLGLWAATVASAARRKQAIDMALGSLVLIILVYLPIRDELARAGARWGIDIWSNPMALSQLVLDIGSFWGNGLESLLPGIAACVGLVIMLRKGRNIGLYIVLAWAVSVLAAAAMGVGGQPRSYFYLLPTFIIAATCGIVYSVRSVRLHALVSGLMLSGYVGVA
jgi:4-amino-4-deoxy-L-arabinose transferase-like glycosyltransferase